MSSEDKEYPNEKSPLILSEKLEDENGRASSAHSSWCNDVYDTTKLAVPIFFSRLSWVGMKTTDTAFLGHVSAEALSASALSDLWTMSR